MNELKFYKLAAIVLLVINLGWITSSFVPKKNMPPVPKEDMSAVKRLQLNETQHEEFLGLAQSHMQQMRKLDSEQAAILKNYFDDLFSSSVNDKKEDMFLELCRIERRKIQSTGDHFSEIKMLLNNDQLPLFDSFVDHAISRILGEPKGKRPPPPPPRGGKEQHGSLR